MKRLPTALSIFLIFWALEFELRAAESQFDRACKTEISSAIPGWKLSPPPDDLAAYAKTLNLQTNIARADFDDDGSDDLTLLVVPLSWWKHRSDISPYA